MGAERLHRLADVEEIRIGFRRPDGSTRSVPIWVVQVGDHIYVRSVRGPEGGWYRRLRADPDGEVRDGGHRHPVRAEAVTDASMLDQVTRAYATRDRLSTRPCDWTRPDDLLHRRTPPCE